MEMFDWSNLLGTWPTLCSGLWITLQITLVAVVVGTLLGTLLAVLRLSNIAIFAGFARIYVGFFRSIPLVMVLLWFFLITPDLLRKIPGISPHQDIRLISAMVAFSLFEAAYYSEIIRAGIQSISRGQLQAALALGLRYPQAMGLIILPQAFKAMVPVLLTQGIILFQDTSLVYVIGLADFFRTASNIGDRDGTLVEMVILAGLVYLIMSLAISGVVHGFRKKVLR